MGQREPTSHFLPKILRGECLHQRTTQDDDNGGDSDEKVKTIMKILAKEIFVEISNIGEDIGEGDIVRDIGEKNIGEDINDIGEGHSGGNNFKSVCSQRCEGQRSR